MMECSKVAPLSGVYLLVTVYMLCLGCGSMCRVCNASGTPVTGVMPTASLVESIDSLLEVPGGNKVQQLVLAVGHQIYNCNGSAWVVANASAILYNFRGQPVGHHYFLNEADSAGGQPTWKTYNPISQVTGRSVARLPQTDAVDWVLLKATTAKGNGKLFGSTTFIQRLYTQHGLPPPNGFNSQKGDVYESPYAAIYTFWEAQEVYQHH
ncbi:hypothetical protein Mapa_003758 [Marchantia paleacea]|nr:hypothetical protein Mapa_003758 [Marchantia paleacea]